jgi:hypothetical protein
VRFLSDSPSESMDDKRGQSASRCCLVLGEKIGTIVVMFSKYEMKNLEISPTESAQGKYRGYLFVRFFLVVAPSHKRPEVESQLTQTDVGAEKVGAAFVRFGD